MKKKSFIYDYFLVSYSSKLDGVGPVDNRPSTTKLHHFVRKKRKTIVTYDTWHMTRDMFGGGGWKFSQILAP